MAVATVTLTMNKYPSGNDNSQRHQIVFGTGAFIGGSPSYVQGGLRMNFANLESIKVSPGYQLPVWFGATSQAGYVYQYAHLGAQITNVALTSNVVTITALNNLATGDIVLVSGVTTATFLNNQPLTVLAGSLSATSFTANFTHANYGSASDTGYVLPTTYATGLPFQGNLVIRQSAGSAASQVELATGALPAAIVGSSTVNADVLDFRAEFIRL